MVKKVLVSALALSALVGVSFASGPAFADNGRHGAFAAGAAAGVVGGALLGAGVAPGYGYAHPGPVYEEQRCYIRRESFEDEYGDVHIRRVRVCR